MLILFTMRLLLSYCLVVNKEIYGPLGTRKAITSNEVIEIIKEENTKLKRPYPTS